ncbi:MAG: DUF6338 family protein [Rhodospirillaceae bacterium]|nr:DUF6338 family protein [Rhodospirillaceae bacterium]MDE0616551.1 DUF6338 family protein [Rhodospirillaceae bacterium]
MAVSWISGEVVGTLTYLLPGFVAAGIFYSLTSHPKPSAFDRTVLALIFTVIGQTITEFILLPTASAVAGAQTFKGWEPALSVLVAILLGLGASFFSNTDVMHWILRRLRFTRETSYPSEWYSTFARYGDRCFLVLHLQGERRLFGFAEEWPSNPKDGHFRIADAEWLIGEDKRVPATGVDAILIPATEVTMMEFVPIATEERHEEAM